MRGVTAALLTLSLTGCANMPGRFNEPGNRPEAILQASRKEAVSALTNWMLDKGWQVKTADDLHIVFTRVADSLGSMMQFGTNANAFPEARATYAIVDVEGGVRLVCTLKMVSNPGSGQEMENEPGIGSGKYTDEVRASIKALQNKFARP